MTLKLIIYSLCSLIIGQFFTSIEGPTWIYWFFTLPGTVFHESAHWLVAYMLNGNPSGFSIFPTFDAAGNMQTMGHVYSYLNWYNAAAIGLAPLLLLPATAIFVVSAAKSKSVLFSLSLVYGAACAWAACIPSWPDLATLRIVTSIPFALLMLAFSSWVTYKMIKTGYTVKNQ